MKTAGKFLLWWMALMLWFASVLGVGRLTIQRGFAVYMLSMMGYISLTVGGLLFWIFTKALEDD